MVLPRFVVVVLTISLARWWNSNDCWCGCLALASSPSPQHQRQHTSSPDESPTYYCLQSPHRPQSPSQALRRLADACDEYGWKDWDVYGDYDATSEQSWLRRMEQTLAHDLGMQDAVLMPSGVTAQAIALLIHKDHYKDASTTATRNTRFACHYSSHLLLHEQDAYRELLHMEPVVMDTRHDKRGIHVPPMRYSDVNRVLQPECLSSQPISTLIVELPHRELGGKLTPFQDLIQMRDFCHRHDMFFHLDGARLLEATSGYDDITDIKDLTGLFDSVYISLYKGLGGLSGAVLLGRRDFCSQARTWLRRFGGNIYTLLPYAISGWDGYQRHWKLASTHVEESPPMSFGDKKCHLVACVQALTADSTIASLVTFDPPVPETNMVHGYFHTSVQSNNKKNISMEDIQRAIDEVTLEQGIRVIKRLKPLPAHATANNDNNEEQYCAMFEWTMGDHNGHIARHIVLQGWRALAAKLLHT